ncbi:MAG TPA: HAMP domain-containing sensor histidine kinase [Ilumatobacteraceae bacterium]|nr:HAMP domain-containing sensor histidine kinase [Ilumatobacteraceae bacterium]
MWRGIRWRITSVATVVVLVVLVVAAFGIVRWERIVLVDNLDEALTAQVLAVADVATPDSVDRNLNLGLDDDAITEIRTAQGGGLVAMAGPARFPAELELPDDSQVLISTITPRGSSQEYRVASTSTGGLVVRVGVPLDDVDESTAALIVAFSIAIPVVTLLLAALIWWLVGRTLRPVESIRRQVSEITGQDLHHRVSEPPADDEIGRLAFTMNQMLDRLEASSEQQRRFVADASHELRSPLTRIRSEIEVDLAHPDTADVDRTIHSVLQETEQMQRLVDDLLTLARFDESGHGHTRIGELPLVDLDEVVRSEVNRVRPAATVTLDIAAVAPVQVHGDGDQLHRMVRNVIDNAVRYAHTTATITLEAVDRTAVLTIADDGRGIPIGQREVVFERFTRLDDSRTRDADGRSDGTGLGLAIARAIVTRHAGTIVVDPEFTPGTRIVIALPAADSTKHHASDERRAGMRAAGSSPPHTRPER